KKEDVVFYGKFRDYLAQVAKSNGLNEGVGENYISVSRKFKSNPFGDMGLSSWEEIDPRTMASKTYLVIKKANKPLHFREVADVINKTGFDDKKALPQTIHNELIKDPRFILVGRGIYGLGEQGYLPGTAKEIIHRILKKDGPMTSDKLIDAVSQQRFLEKNTVLLNLQNKKHFKRLPDGKYAIIGKFIK
ncbi:MAG: winged helix-turn-helix domain-containing protein, partial [Candidatus Wolfebacteria bacterium]|nr:winged helix-turn-helix domain-containing protein [Candidatus Wolfebacteria bacterium]